MNRSLILLISLILFCHSVSAQTLDPNFSAKFINRGQVRDMQVQNDGKILVSGKFAYANESISPGICRFNADGTVDDTFNNGRGANDYVQCLAIQSDGKIIAGGRFTIFDGLESNRIVRLHPDGSIDDSFEVGEGFDDQVLALAIDNNHNIFVGGKFDSFNGITCNGLIKLHPDGSVDESFEIDQEGTTQIADIELQSNEQPVLIALGGNYMGNSQDILRLNLDGSIDTTFVLDLSIFLGPKEHLIVLPDDRIAMPTKHNLSNGEYGLLILEPSGSEEGFYTGNVSFPGFTGITADQNGNIYFGRYEIYRFDDNTNEIEIIDDIEPAGFIHSLTIHQDGTLLAGGWFDKVSNLETGSIFKLTPDHTVDIGFSAGLFDPGRINDIVQQGDGKIIVGGHFSKVNGQSIPNLVRLNEDGSIDETFQQSVTSGYVYDLLLTNGGNNLLTGISISTHPGDDGIRAYNLDGSIDPSFNIPNTEGVGRVEKMEASPSGEIYVMLSGLFGLGIETPGVGFKRFARLLPDGSADPSFFQGLTTISSDLYEVAITSGNKTFLAAQIGVGGESPNMLTRFNPDWTLDSTFDPIEYFSSGYGANAIVEDETGKLLIAGFFSSVDSVEVSKSVVRMNDDGSIDYTFDAGTGFSYRENVGNVYEIALLNSDQYILNGEFTDYNGTSVPGGLTVINSDGSLSDCEFDLTYGIVNQVSVIDSTSFFAVGAFLIPNAPEQNSIAKYIDVCEEVTVSHEVVNTEDSGLNVFPNPAFDELNIRYNGDNSSEYALSVYNVLGDLIIYENGQINRTAFSKTISLENFASGTYILILETDNRIETKKLIKM